MFLTLKTPNKIDKFRQIFSPAVWEVKLASKFLRPFLDSVFPLKVGAATTTTTTPLAAWSSPFCVFGGP